jgi:hypothetical protein
VKKISEKKNMATHVDTLPQLKDGANFQNWKYRITLILEERGIKESITNCEFIKKESANETNTKNDARAKSAIAQALSDKYLEYIKKCETAYQMIQALESVFERKSAFNKLYLRKQLLTLKCGSNENLTEHFLKFESLINKLQNISCTTMDESDKICHLLLTIPSKYDNIVSTIETLSNDKELTVEFVKSCLLDGELKLKQQEKIPDETSFNVRVPMCSQCKKRGHRREDCWFNPENKRGNSKHYKRGHQAKYKTSTNVAVNNTEENYSFYSDEHRQEYKNGKCNIEWIIDSGCTEHLIQYNYLNYMTELKEIDDVKIYVANVQYLTSKLKGKIKMNYKGKYVDLEALLVENLTFNLLSVKKIIQKGFNVTLRSIMRLHRGDSVCLNP